MKRDKLKQLQAEEAGRAALAAAAICCAQSKAEAGSVEARFEKMWKQAD